MLTRFTKRGRHWRSANLAYVDGLVNQASTHPPHAEALLVALAVYSSVIVNALLVGSGELDRLVEIDVVEVSSDQFQLVHKTNIWSLSAVFLLINPRFEKDIFSLVSDWIGIHQSTAFNRILQFNEVNYYPISSIVISEICRILPCNYVRDDDGKILDIELNTTFCALFGHVANGFVKTIKESWEKA